MRLKVFGYEKLFDYDVGDFMVLLQFRVFPCEQFRIST